jgi:hypothetical protein
LVTEVYRRNPMLISYEKQFLFLHIPKTGGTSIRSALRPYRNPLERKLYVRILRRIPLTKTKYLYHNFDAYPHWPMLKAKAILPPTVFSRLYKFTFVRHPVSWQLSVFKHILRHEHMGEYSKGFEPVFKHPHFEDYIRWRIDMGPVPQITQMLDENGRLLIDYVGRYERLEQDFNAVCNTINVSCNLEHLNRSPQDQSVEVSEKAVELIAGAYKVDFEAFGYTATDIDDHWKLDFSRDYQSVAQILPALGHENFDPWRVYNTAVEFSN